MKTLHFACGATYELKDDQAIELTASGRPERLIVFTMSEHVKAPLLHGKPAPCYFNCPARTAISKRKEISAWVGEAAKEPTGKPVPCVFCQPTHVEVREEAAIETRG